MSSRKLAISRAMRGIDPAPPQGRGRVTTYIQKVARANGLSEFLDTATDADLSLVEQHLGITR